jgi:thiol-disulfide isomerase/thioredoxin
MSHRCMLALAALALLCTSCERRGRFGGLAVGKPAPKITATGWLNGKPPSESDLKGKVIVVEAWASWCGPCRAAAPHMVRAYNKFHSQGVVFIGLSSQNVSEVPEMKQFLEDAGIEWPNGYGAVTSLRAFHAEAIPLTWVIGKDGKIAWNSGSKGTLEEAIAAALAQ